LIGEKFMRSGFAALLALGLVVLTDTSLLAQRRGGRFGDPPPARYGWLFSLEEGKAQAHKTGKPLMVVLRCVP
jgi:hypothetical protein